MPLSEMLKAAGPVFWVLLALSVYVLYLLIWRFIAISRVGGDPTLLLTRVHAALMQRDLPGAIRQAQQTGVVSNVVRAGLQRVPTGREGVVQAMNEAAVLEEARLTQSLSMLATVAQISPMLGLLGTVFGMIKAFQVFSQTAAPGASLLAGGISEALINTAMGLVVAIVAYFGRNLLKTKAESVLLHIDRVREALPAWVLEAELRHKGSLSGVPIPIYDPQVAWREESA